MLTDKVSDWDNKWLKQNLSKHFQVRDLAGLSQNRPYVNPNNFDGKRIVFSQYEKLRQDTGNNKIMRRNWHFFIIKNISKCPWVTKNTPKNHCHESCTKVDFFWVQRIFAALSYFEYSENSIALLTFAVKNNRYSSKRALKNLPLSAN